MAASMMQLVGLDCVLCSETISSVLDGKFCSTCGCPVHSRCTKPSANRSGACAACGADAASIASHRERSQEEAATEVRQLRAYHWTWGLMYLGGGVVLLAAGIMTVVGSVKAVSEGRGVIVLWYGAIFVGGGLILRGLVHFRAARRLAAS